jgi:hypothetical protein
MTGEAKAQRAFRVGMVGYYVRNAQTLIPVAGPFSTVAAAQRECEHRDGLYAHDFEVIRVLDAKERHD